MTNRSAGRHVVSHAGGDAQRRPASEISLGSPREVLQRGSQSIPSLRHRPSATSCRHACRRRVSFNIRWELEFEFMSYHLTPSHLNWVTVSALWSYPVCHGFDQSDKTVRPTMFWLVTATANWVMYWYFWFYGWGHVLILATCKRDWDGVYSTCCQREPSQMSIVLL